MNKILCIQISTNLINGKLDLNDISQRYYNTLYKIKEKQGYYKGPDFWESPLWITEINHNVKTDLHVCTDTRETIDYINNSDYTHICFSVLDVNSEIIKYIVKQCKTKQFIIGGYANLTYFKNSNNAHVFKSIKDFIEYLGLQYKKGYSYGLFKGFKTIPRLNLSNGCLHNCDFCTIENKITKIPTHIIEQQVKAFKPLKFKLVYINDKTFSQCSNYKLLPRIYKAIKGYNKDFEGFIIQTTTTAFNKLDNKFIYSAHIKYVELGIETFNNSILRKYNKPSSETTTLKACEKIRSIANNHYYPLNIKLIPNIIIGMLEETTDTYLRTLYFLNDNKDIISHLNIYNLAVYENTALANRVKPPSKNNNELKVNTSKQHHVNFYNHVHKFAIDVLTGV